MTYFDETMPFDTTEHDTDNPTTDLPEEAVTDEAALEATIANAEEFALENEKLLLQEGAQDFEDVQNEEKPKKPGRKSKKKAEPEQEQELESESKEEFSEEPVFDETSSEELYEASSPSEDLPEDVVDTEGELSVEENLVDMEGELPLEEGRPPSDARFYMDEDGKYVEDISNPYRAEHQRLSSAVNRRDLLSGHVEGFELNSMEIPRVFLYIGDVKVIIPISHLDLPLLEEALNDPLEARLAVNAILGAKIYFMVLKVNFPERVAVASRTLANQRRRAANLNRVTGDGDYKIRPGVLCTAQVIHIAERFVRIDIYGFETVIGVAHISNLWVSDIREILDVGSEVMVEIVSVERNPNSKAVNGIVASMKLAEQKKEIKLEENRTYTGTVSGFSPVAYFVRVAGMEKEVRCPISKCYTGKLIESGDYVKFFVDSFRDEIPSGSILKILKKSEKSLMD